MSYAAQTILHCNLSFCVRSALFAGDIRPGFWRDRIVATLAAIDSDPQISQGIGSENAAGGVPKIVPPPSPISERESHARETTAAERPHISSLLPSDFEETDPHEVGGIGA